MDAEKFGAEDEGPGFRLLKNEIKLTLYKNNILGVQNCTTTF